jgi:hypothetical protein
MKGFVRAIACVVLVACLAPSVAFAQDDKLAKAKGLFEAGGRAYDRAQYDVALQAFQQAYELVPKDGLLFSIAQSHRRLHTMNGDARHREQAISAYRLYLDHVKSGGRVSEAVKALEELNAGATPPSTPNAPATPTAPVALPAEKKTRLYVTSSTPGVMISIDGGPLSEPNATVTAEVTPGRHQVFFTAPGYVEKTLDAEALKDELVPVSQDLVEQPALLALETESGAEISVDGRFMGEFATGQTFPLPSGRRFVVASRSGHQTRAQTIELEPGKTHRLELALPSTLQRDISFIVLGASGAALITTGVLTGVAFAKQGEAEDVLERQASGNISDADIAVYDEAASERDTYAIAAGSMGAATGVLAVVGLGMLLIDPPERITAPSAEEKPDAPAKDPSKLELEALGVGPYADGVAGFARVRF